MAKIDIISFYSKLLIHMLSLTSNLPLDFHLNLNIATPPVQRKDLHARFKKYLRNLTAKWSAELRIVILNVFFFLILRMCEGHFFCKETFGVNVKCYYYLSLLDRFSALVHLCRHIM